MLGSCSNGSSGPSPKTSCSTSWLMRCFSAAVSSVGLLLHHGQHGLPHFVVDTVVIDAGERFQVDALQQFAVQRELQLLVFGLDGLAAGGVAQQALRPIRAGGIGNSGRRHLVLRSGENVSTFFFDPWITTI